MKHLKSIVKKYLEDNPTARERKMRNLAVWQIMVTSNNRVSDTVISKTDFITFAFKSALSINRIINHTQQHYPELRGKDYGDKKKLQQKAMVDLDYSPGIDQQIKKLNQI